MSKDKGTPKKSAKETNSTPLSGYKQTKKILTPPMASIPNMVLQSWTNDRLPDMLWAVLIRHSHPGQTGYAIFRQILRWLGDNISDDEVQGVTHTDIANMPDGLREKFIAHIVGVAGTTALRPLLLLPGLPAYDDWKKALSNSKPDPNKDWDQMAKSVEKVLWHQSQEATDVRWVKLMGMILRGNIKFVEGMFDNLDELNEYPNMGDQRKVRPRIRSMEMMSNMTDTTPEWPEKFWDFVYKETQCFPEIGWQEADIKERYADGSKDKKFYGQPLADIGKALWDHFESTSKSTKIDVRHEAVFGLAVYALDTFIENCILETASTISGRATARIIFETYITLAHLLKKESDGEHAWDTYRDYGNGQMNLINRKFIEESYESSMVDPKKIDRLANEDKWSEYVPISLGNWDETDLRKICVSLGKKDLYDKFYPYTSGYVHANWGAVREAAFQTCYNPLHRLHRIPSYGLPILPGVNDDTVQLLNLIFGLVDSAYPDFKHQLKVRPKNENKPVKPKKQSRNKKAGT